MSETWLILIFVSGLLAGISFEDLSPATLLAAGIVYAVVRAIIGIVESKQWKLI